MPKSQKPRKPYAGNRCLLTSQEARELRAAIAVVAHQVNQLSAMFVKLRGRLEPPAPAAAEDSALVP